MEELDMRRFQRHEPESYVRRVSEVEFPIVMRGYDRAAVDAFVEDVSRIVAELETRQSSDTVIKRALDDVGEQTSAILQKAHESAEEITRKSRAQADDRLQTAEREAAEVRREAEELRQRAEEDMKALLGERREIVEEIRRLADELLGVADDAIERMEPTEQRHAPDLGAVAEPEAHEPADATLIADLPEIDDEPPEYEPAQRDPDATVEFRPEFEHREDEFRFDDEDEDEGAGEGEGEGQRP